jgi:putative Holliday junction resolvase
MFRVRTQYSTGLLGKIPGLRILIVKTKEWIIATGLTTVSTPTLLQFLKDYCQKEPVDIFLVGQPKHMDNTPSQSSKIIEPFVQQLAQTFPEKEIARIDERFTSKMAFQAMIDGGLKKKQRQDKGMVDQVSATIMLQDYMRTLQ